MPCNAAYGMPIKTMEEATARLAHEMSRMARFSAREAWWFPLANHRNKDPPELRAY